MAFVIRCNSKDSACSAGRLHGGLAHNRYIDSVEPMAVLSGTADCERRTYTLPLARANVDCCSSIVQSKRYVVEIIDELSLRAI